MRRALLFSLAAALPAMAAAQSSEPQVPASRIIERCIPPAEREAAWDALGANRQHEMMACLQAASSDILNEQMPVRIDEITVLERTSSEGTALIYHNRIERDASELPADVGARLEQSARDYACAQPPMVRTIGRGGAYGYVWVDRAGRPVHRMTITRC